MRKYNGKRWSVRLFQLSKLTHFSRRYNRFRLIKDYQTRARQRTTRIRPISHRRMVGLINSRMHLFVHLYKCENLIETCLNEILKHSLNWNTRLEKNRTIILSSSNFFFWKNLTLDQHHKPPWTQRVRDVTRTKSIVSRQVARLSLFHHNHYTTARINPPCRPHCSRLSLQIRGFELHQELSWNYDFDEIFHNWENKPGFRTRRLITRDPVRPRLITT